MSDTRGFPQLQPSSFPPPQNLDPPAVNENSHLINLRYNYDKVDGYFVPIMKDILNRLSSSLPISSEPPFTSLIGHNRPVPAGSLAFFGIYTIEHFEDRGIAT